MSEEIARLRAEVARLTAELEVSNRRRDKWREKAEGYDAVRRALREKVGAPWPPSMSRILWAGIAADEKKRADDAEAELARIKVELGAVSGCWTAQECKEFDRRLYDSFRPYPIDAGWNVPWSVRQDDEYDPDDPYYQDDEDD